jgi:hypothetical protein
LTRHDPTEPDPCGAREGQAISTKAKDTDRAGLVFTLGLLLSSLGIGMVALLCCGVPLLLVAAGVLGAAGSIIGSPWMIAVAAVVAAVPVIRIRRRRGAEGSAAAKDDRRPTKDTAPR